VLAFPADDPELAIEHLSYLDPDHYLLKLNRYTAGEAENLDADGASHAWQAMIAAFVQAWQGYYERGRADLDGMHGFLLSFFSGFYEFAARAKLWDRRRQRGELPGAEPVPRDLREMLEYMAQVVQRGPGPWLDPANDQPSRGHSTTKLWVPGPQPANPPTPQSAIRNPQSPVRLLLQSPLFGPSGYEDGARNLAQALIEAGEPVALAPERWGDGDAGLAGEARAALEARVVPLETPAEVRVSYTLLPLQRPSPAARVNVARTMFVTDRLPPEAATLAPFDRVWVPSEFNREAFARNGVDSATIAVIPESIDPAPFAADVEPWPVPGDETFKILAVFDWTLHKGWDVLLEATALEFGATKAEDPGARAGGCC
jgi:hypothetical protein